jgi:O-antigen/teichoic acid export membrane protein
MNSILQAIIYAGSNFLSMAVNSAVGIVIRLWVLPEAFGAVNFAKGIQQYLQTVGSVLNNAVDREVPAHIGRKDHTGAERVLQATYSLGFGWAILETIIFLILSFFVSGWYLKISSLVLAVTAFTTTSVNLDSMALKATQRFKTIGKSLTFTAAIGSIATVALCWLLQEAGYFIALLVSAVLGFVIIRRNMRRGWLPYLSVRLSRRVLGRVMSIGGLFMMFRLSRDLMVSVDRYFITWFFGVKSLGLYSLGTMIMGQINMIPQTLIGSYMPRMIGDLAAERFDSARRAAEKLHPTSVIIGVIFACVTLAVVDPLVQRFLPAYLGVVSAVQVLLIGGCMRTSSGTALQIHVGMERFKRLNLIGLAGFVTSAVLCYCLRSLGLVGMALAVTIATTFYCFLMNISVRQLLKTRFFVAWQTTGMVAVSVVYFLAQHHKWTVLILVCMLYISTALMLLRRIHQIRFGEMVTNFKRYLRSKEE